MAESDARRAVSGVAKAGCGLGRNWWLGAFLFSRGARILYLTATGMPAPRRLTAQAFWGDQATPPFPQ